MVRGLHIFDLSLFATLFLTLRVLFTILLSFTLFLTFLCRCVVLLFLPFVTSHFPIHHSV